MGCLSSPGSNPRRWMGRSQTHATRRFRKDPLRVAGVAAAVRMRAGSPRWVRSRRKRSPAMAKKRILFIDNRPEHLKQPVVRLQLEGYDVEEADSGAAGLEALRS